jgi:hypothetical protein
LLKVPNTIDCPSMAILDNWGERIFTGTGQFHVRSGMQIDFSMHAVPVDGNDAFRRVVQAQKYPSDIHHQFKVQGTQYDGTTWDAGYTELRIGDMLGDTWHLGGTVGSLVTGVSGPFTASTNSIEVIYDSRLRLPLPMNMTTSILRGDREVLRKMEPGGKSIDVVGTQIDFFIDPELDATWAVAPTSEDFAQPYAENWVSEPLCILLGQLVFPRLVARNANQGATIWLRRSQPVRMDNIAASILRQDPLEDHARFWDTYQKILTMISRARDEHGHRNFEAHRLTHYYHEIIQASRGSNWAWCLTLASSIEGVVKLLTPESELDAGYPPGAIASLKRHIKSWGGDEDLRNRVLGSVKFAETKGIAQILQQFVASGAIEKTHVDTWKSVRNQVTHGKLVAPWAEEETQEQMRVLADLMHRMSMMYIEKCAA